MKEAGRVTGIIGGAIAIVCSIFLIVAMAVSSVAVNNGAVQKAIDEAMEHVDPNVHNFFDDFPELDQYDLGEIVRAGIIAGFSAVMALAAIALIGGAFGLAGGIIIHKKPDLAGIFLIIGAVLTAVYFVTAILIGIAAIFAFIRPKAPVPTGSGTGNNAPAPQETP